ncbi:uncharacterized protein LOC130541155 [Pan paniscus]|uniref:uncharacterized protein LOC130541155 n=1 Tax=Pan paniscus TaxID=9597 RepID=UPI0025463D91|nr:uncharacterized protein LOC130541155 [Pan paniscus]
MVSHCGILRRSSCLSAQFFPSGGLSGPRTSSRRLPQAQVVLESASPGPASQQVSKLFWLNSCPAPNRLCRPRTFSSQALRAHLLPPGGLYRPSTGWRTASAGPALASQGPLQAQLLLPRRPLGAKVARGLLGGRQGLGPGRSRWGESWAWRLPWEATAGSADALLQPELGLFSHWEKGCGSEELGCRNFGVYKRRRELSQKSLFAGRREMQPGGTAGPCGRQRPGLLKLASQTHLQPPGVLSGPSSSSRLHLRAGLWADSRSQQRLWTQLLPSSQRPW